MSFVGTLYNLFDAHAKLFCFRFAITGFLVIHVVDSLLKVTVYLQIDNFLQIWIFGSKSVLVEVWSLIFLKKLMKKTTFVNIGREITVSCFCREVKVYPLIDSPMMLCNQPRQLLRDYTDWCEELATQLLSWSATKHLPWCNSFRYE